MNMKKEIRNFTPQTYILFLHIFYCAVTICSLKGQWANEDHTWQLLISFLRSPFHLFIFQVSFAWKHSSICCINDMMCVRPVFAINANLLFLIDLIATHICSLTIIIIKTQLVFYTPMAYPNTFTTRLVNQFPFEAKHWFLLECIWGAGGMGKTNRYDSLIY